MKFSLSNINLKFLLDKHRYLAAAIGIVVFCVGLVVIGLVPQIQAALDLYQSQQQETARLESLEKKAQDLANITSSPLIAQIQTVETVLPSKKPLVDLMNSLNTSAQEAQVTVTSIELTPGSIATESAGAVPTGRPTGARRGNTKNYEILDIDLKVAGQLGNLKQFFELIENRAPLSTLTSIKLNKKERLGATIQDSDQFEAELQVTGYYFTQSVSVAVESSLPTLSSQQESLLEQLRSFILPQPFTQTEIRGGGLGDLFGVEKTEFEEQNEVQ